MDQSRGSGELQDHIFGTYISLRRGMTAIGAAFPVLLLGLGFASGLGWRSSISAYYWAALPGETPPLRDLFVGSLFAIAAGLHLYKGFTTPENVALNLAGIFGVGVAVFPTPQVECVGRCPLLTLHGFCAISMFASLAFVVLRCAGDTLSLLDPASAARYRKQYAFIGLVMLASPLTAFVMNSVAGRGKSYVFWVELAGIWAFARYWWVKSGELEKSSATKRALQGELKTTPEGKAEEARAKRG